MIRSAGLTLLYERVESARAKIMRHQVTCRMCMKSVGRTDVDGRAWISQLKRREREREMEAQQKRGMWI